LRLIGNDSTPLVSVTMHLARPGHSQPIKIGSPYLHRVTDGYDGQPCTDCCCQSVQTILDLSLSPIQVQRHEDTMQLNI
jgi:hypothetical protein